VSGGAPAIDVARNRLGVARLIAGCARISAERDDWASRSRNLRAVVDGVACAAHVKAEALRHDAGSARRVTGDLFVYLTPAESEGETGGIGWLHFAMAEDSLEHSASLYDCAFAQACASLRGKHFFRALAEREVLHQLGDPSASPRIATPRRL
jgi:hypothetical protein